MPTPGSFERITLDGDQDDVATSGYDRIPDSMTADELDDIQLMSPSDRSRTSSEQPVVARTTSASGRARTSSEQPLVARTTSASGRARTSSEQPLGSGTTSLPDRQRTSSEQPLGSGTRSLPDRQRTSSEQPLVARTTSPSGRARTSSEQPLGSGTTSFPDRSRTSEQPLVARTTSASGRARTSSEQPLASGTASLPDRQRTSSEQPLVARTTSASGRERTSSEQPLVARTTSPSGRARTSSEQPLGSGTTSFPDRSRTSSEQPLGGRAPSQTGDRTRSPSQPGERTKSPSGSPGAGIPIEEQRPRTSSSGPIDLAARLHAAPIAIAIKPPRPEPIPVPDDQIPVAPESGLVIRKRTPSAAPLSSHQLPMSSPLSTSGAMASTAPVVIRPRSSSASGRTPPGAMPSVGLRSVSDDMSGLATKSATPPLAIPVVGADAFNVELERKRATPPRAMPAIDVDVMSLELEAKSITPPLAMPVVDESVSLSFEPTPLPVAPAPAAPLAAPAPVAAAASQASTSERAADSLEDLIRTQPRMKPVKAAAHAWSNPLAGKLSYAVTSATLTSMGISAQREDGTQCEVVWESIVGIIARRLPNEPPYDGTTFVDLVSEPGSTLRFLPWTQIHGAPVFGEGEERARAFVQLIAMRCLDAKLDSWTKVFADGTGHAAQLPSAKMLAAHDERLA